MGWLDGLLGGFGSIVGSGINAGVQSSINKQNADLQKEFAQNSLQWKVQDAKKAGIAPEIALGAQGYSASPSFVGSDVGSGVSSAFKHFGSAIDSYIDDKSEERKLQLEGLRLDNAEKRQKLNSNVFGGLNSNDFVASVGAPSVAVDDINKKGDISLNKVLGVSKRYEFSPKTNGELVITLNPNSVDGQQVSDGSIIGPTSAYHTDALRDDVYQMRNTIISNARKAGILKKGYTYEFKTGFNKVTLIPIKVKDYPYSDKPSYPDEFERNLRKWWNSW